MKKLFVGLLLMFMGVSLQAQTPYQVKVINGGGADARPERMIEFNGKLLFRARTAAQGVEPWISDGTEAGTMLLKDINDNPAVITGNSNPDNFTLYRGKVYFSARDAENGSELWVTDGTTEGTFMLKDINPTGLGAPIDFVVFKDLLFFTANDGTNSSELWVSDGTAEGTRLFLDINPAGGTSNPGSKTVIGDFMYFSASNGPNGNEIWRSDGTVEGTKMIKDIRPGTANSLPSRFFGFKKEVFFRANDGTNGVELWKTDGTEEGTVLVKDIRPGSGNSNPDNFFIAGGRLYFTADDSISGTELWVTDGTPEGTLLAADLNPGAGSSSPANIQALIPGVMLMTANDGETGVEPWLFLNVLGFTDAALLQDLNPGTAGSNPSFFVDNGYSVYFSAVVEGFGRELYVLPIDADSIQRIADINPGAGDGKVEELTRVGNRIFFRADNGTDGLQLWAMEAPVAQIAIRDGNRTLAPGDTLDFGDVPLGTTAERQLKIANTGQAPLIIFDYGFFDLNVFYSDLLEDEVAPGDSVLLNLEFTPRGLGLVEEDFAVISFSVDNKTYPLVLRANGVAEVVAIAGFLVDGAALESGDTLRFGTVQVGMDSVRAINIRNTGNAVLRISNVQTAGMTFAVEALPDSIAPGATARINVTFRPTASGLQTGSLSLRSNAPNADVFAINFSGTGQTPTSIVEPVALGIEVFPNPVEETLFIHIRQPFAKGSAQLFNSTGQLLREASLAQQAMLPLNLRGLPSGTYFLRLNDGSHSAFMRVVKQ